MRAIAAGVTDVGRERDHNEDRFVLLPEFEVFVVADGMGGHQCGEVASRMATATIASYFREHQHAPRNGMLSEVLRASLLEANQRIHRRATSSTIHRGMGTTVVAAAFSRFERKMVVAHAGDSRCYRLRDGQLHALTRDHSLVEEALRNRPDITHAELAYLPANVITRALGVEPTVDIEVSEDSTQLGDVYLLCSDGLYGFASEERIRDIMNDCPVLTSACAELVAEANENGGGDNITAVLVRIEEQEEAWAVSTSVPPAPDRLAAPPSSKAIASQPLPEIVGAAVLTAPDAEEELRDTALSTSEARLAFAVDDTAQNLPAITDADAILAALDKSDPDTIDTVETELPEEKPDDESTD